MNFFMKKNSQTNSKLTKPDIEKLLQEAYQANPKCYEKKDGTLLIGLALTEDTDSLFPIVQIPISKIAAARKGERRRLLKLSVVMYRVGEYRKAIAQIHCIKGTKSQTVRSL